VLKFGPVFARWLRHLRPRASALWNLDEMVVRIRGEQMYLWQAVDHEGQILDIPVQCRRDRQAAVKLMRKLLKGLLEIGFEVDLTGFSAAQVDLIIEEADDAKGWGPANEDHVPSPANEGHAASRRGELE
jgi:hypothetical protein